MAARFDGELEMQRALRSRARLQILAALPCVAASFAITLRWIESDLIVLLVLLGLVGFTGGAIVAARLSARPGRSKAPVRVDVDEEWIRVDGREHVRREEIADAVMQPIAGAGDTRMAVVLVPRSRTRRSIPLRFVASNETQARAFLAALDLSPARQAFRCELATPPRWAIAGPIALAVAVISGLVLGLFLDLSFDRFLGEALRLIIAFVMGGTAIALASLGSTTVVVGMDGVEVTRRRQRRFLPFDQIREVKDERHAITIVLARGAPVRLVWAGDAPPMHGNELLLGHRIREAISARATDPAAMGDRAHTFALTRGARTVAEWFAALRAMAAGAGDYRAAAVPLDDARRALGDPKASTEVRAAAAIVLRVASETEDIARIRIAADTTAEAELRATLQAIAEEDDIAKLERPLAKLAATRRD